MGMWNTWELEWLWYHVELVSMYVLKWITIEVRGWKNV